MSGAIEELEESSWVGLSVDEEFSAVGEFSSASARDAPASSSSGLDGMRKASLMTGMNGLPESYLPLPNVFSGMHEFIKLTSLFVRELVCDSS
jgi:hypothetical protein